MDSSNELSSFVPDFDPQNTHLDVQDQALRSILLRLDEIVARVDTVENRLIALDQKLADLIASHNQVGENIAWLCANTQGIFQLFSDPAKMSAMMGMVPGMFGGGNSGGRPEGSRAGS